MSDLTPAEQPITVADVFAYSPVGLKFARNLAAYANHRAAGMYPADALGELGLDMTNKARYERFLRGFRASQGLTDLAELPDRPSHPDTERSRQAGLSGTHQRWHVDRGISNPDCELCAADLRQGAQ